MAGLSAYEEIVRGERHDAMVLAAAVPGPVDLVTRVERSEFEIEDDRDALRLRSTEPSGLTCRVSTDAEPDFHDPGGFDLTPTDRESIRAAGEWVVVEALLGADWRRDAAAVVNLVAELCPEAVGLYDVGAFQFWSPRWLVAVAAGRPLRLSELFNVHFVVNEGVAWAHTHGLLRLGLPELEVSGDFDDLPMSLAQDLINAAAAVFATCGVPPARTPFRIGWGNVAEWEPWQDFEWEEGGLGGPDDRDDPERPSAVLSPTDAEVPLAAGLRYGDEGWAESTDEADFGGLARMTAASAWKHASARSSRSMWVASGDVSGRAISFDGSVFEVDADGKAAGLMLESLESWVVRTPSGFGRGPWFAYNVEVIEELEVGRKPTHDPEGRPLCLVCGQPLGPDHACDGD